MFDEVDANGSGLDQKDFSTLTVKISEAIGEEVDAEEIFCC
jgi:hypothetical protein